MWRVNSALSVIFDILFRSFQNVNPIWALIFLSLFTGILLLLIFRYISDQAGIRKTKDKIQAHLLEIRIFKDNLGILLSAQKNVLRYNFLYLKHAIKPMIFMIVPVAIIIIQADGWFGYRPLMRGETAIVSVSLSKDDPSFYSNISIIAGRGVLIENPPLRIPDRNEMNWKVRAQENGTHSIQVSLFGEEYEEELIVSQRGFHRVSRLIVGSSFWDIVSNPGARPADKDSIIRRIAVSYPQRFIEVSGWNMHWLVVFFILSVVCGFACKGFIGVEL